MRLLTFIISLVCVNAWAEVTSEQFNQWRMQAEQGDADAQYNLGHAYFFGEGVARDYSEAVKWYRKSADQGFAWAQSNLGVCYYNGEGVLKEHAEAIKWYLKAAQQGNDIAQYNLGISYYKGEGVLKDPVEAYAYFNLAGITHEEARKKRDWLEKKMTPSQLEAGISRSKELKKEIEGKITAKAGK